MIRGGKRHRYMMACKRHQKVMERDSKKMSGNTKEETEQQFVSEAPEEEKNGKI